MAAGVISLALYAPIVRRIFYFMKYLIARKKQMTQIFDDKGIVHPGTILMVAPSVVTQLKNAEKDGYTAVQVGYEAQTEKRLSKPQHKKPFKVLKEFRTEDAASYEVGKELSLDTFAIGDTVTIVGTSKGKGFTGVVKRYNFKGGPRTHGQKHSERERGSSGGGPGRAGGRVALGMRMAGRHGTDRVTIKNLRVLHIDPATREIIISGAVPGARNSLVEIVGN